MTTRRRFNRRGVNRPRGPKSNWKALTSLDLVFQDIAADTTATQSLFIPPSGEIESQTILRIVGDIIAIPISAVVGVAQWCIYRAAENAAIFLTTDPSVLGDVDSDDILMWRSLYWSGSGSHPILLDPRVDIKAKRILVPDESRLLFSFHATLATKLAVNLRGLFKESQGR